MPGFNDVKTLARLGGSRWSSRAARRSSAIDFMLVLSIIFVMKAGLASLETDFVLDKLLKDVIGSPLYMSTRKGDKTSLNKRGTVTLSPSDTELVSRVKTGDGEACRFVVERYQRLLYSIAYGILGEHSEADDVVQQIFIRFFENVEKVRRPEALKTYLARSATNEAIDRLRRFRRQKTLSLEDLGDAETLALEDGRTPEESMRRKRLDALIHWALAQLSATQQKVVVLSFTEGLSYTEISQVLECEEVTVRTHLHRARRKLQELLGPRLRDLEAGFVE